MFKPQDNGIQLPVIITDRCTNCKECVDSCPVDAISIIDVAENRL
jgi:ferredoxin